ncbi:RNA polymerase subunit sigma-70, partial [Burkholderia ubonensis]
MPARPAPRRAPVPVRAAGHDGDAPPHAAHLHALISTGLTRGFVTHGDIIDALPDDDAHQGGVDATAAMLRELGIAVSDGAHAAGWTLDRYFQPTPSARAWAEGAGALAAAELSAPRTTDPVRLYLREMGMTPLLTRDEEIMHARRIERGRAASVAVLCGDPQALDALVAMRIEIAEGRTAASAYVLSIADSADMAPAAGAAASPHAGDTPADADASTRDDDAPADDGLCRHAVLARLAPIDALAAAMRAALETDGAHGLAYRACVREAAALLGTLRMSMRALERMSEPLRTHARRQRTL